MPTKNLKLENRSVWMEGDYSAKPVNLKNARIVEGLSLLTQTTIEFLSSNDALDLQDLLGKTITLAIKDAADQNRYFSGTCISVEYVGLYEGLSHFVAETRPFLWFLTRRLESRIFQDKTVVDIIQEVLNDYGFWSDVEKKTTGNYKSRVYCVQYAETDFDFICRLMEEEGIYYYFVQDNKKLKMVLADSISAHKSTPGKSEFDFHFKEAQYRRKDDHIFDWSEATGVTTGKITLNDYDFENPKADKKTAKALPKGNHSHKSYEHYRYPGHSRVDGTGDDFTKVRMEAEAVKHKLSRGAGNIRTLGVGQTFKMKGHPRLHNNIEYLLTHAVHHLKIETDYEDQETKKPLFDNTIPVDEDNKDTYRIIFDVIPKAEPFRAPQTTPWPKLLGLQTAVVTGPSGEEIYTDKYGRIKVQFFWDRVGKKDDNTTCWVRCVMPWTGKNWGMVSIPRIGQEVAIQFEEGDPDRPICTGMLYNADTMPPYTLPVNKTQSGIKTRSSSKGGEQNYNELVFEDKKENEFIRFHSEKDYFQTVENNAEIKIGLDKKDPGDLTQTIYHTKTETIQTGDHVFSVDAGSQSIFIKTNHTETIEGTSTETITGDTSTTVKEGNYTQIISMGDYAEKISEGDVTRDVSRGNEKVTVALGDYTLDASAGSVIISAGTKISLTVGGNSIVIDQSGIKISGIMVSVEGNATVEMSSPVTSVSGDAMLTLEGGVVMIN